MSSPPPTTETHDIDLSTDEQWVVHDVLVTYVDEVLDVDDSPPEWALCVLESVESETTTVTPQQATNLYTLLDSHVDAPDAPEVDVVYGTSALEHLEPIATEA